MNDSSHRTRLLAVGLVALLIATPLSAGAVLAADAGASNDEEVSADDLTDADKVREMAASYNRHADEVSLGPATSQLTNNVVNLYVADASSGETVVFSFRMGADKNITDVAEGENPDANLRMETSMATVEGIANADNPAATFRDAYATDEISIEPTGFAEGGVVKWAFWTAADQIKGILF